MTAPTITSNYGGNLALRSLLGSGLYLALHVSTPTATGLLASEVAGGGYQRQPIHFSAPNGKAVASTDAQTFPGMPACDVAWLAVWDAIADGNMLLALQLVDADNHPAPITVAESGHFLTAPGDIAFAA